MGVKKKNIYKFLTFNERPSNEIDFGINKKDYTRHYYKCKSCGHLIAKHKKLFFDKLYENIYFESTYKSYHELSKTFKKISYLPNNKSDNYHRVQRVKKMITFFFDKKKIDILDVGSGIGIFPIKMMDNNFNISSIEPSKICSKFIKKQSKSKINVINKDFLKIKSKNLKKYNVITFNKVLEHIEKPINFIIKASKLLKKENVIYVEVPDVNAIYDKKEGKFREEFGLGHHHVFSIKSLKNIFKIAKIRMIKIKRIREPSGKYTLFAFGKKG